MSVKKNCASPTKSLTARHWSQRQRRAAYYNFLHFFAVIAGELFLYVQEWFVMMKLQYELKTVTIPRLRTAQWPSELSHLCFLNS